MGKLKDVFKKEAKSEEVVVQEVATKNHEPIVTPVEQHLDRDPNDPRNRPATPKLPSLND